MGVVHVSNTLQQSTNRQVKCTHACIPNRYFDSFWSSVGTCCVHHLNFKIDSCRKDVLMYVTDQTADTSLYHTNCTLQVIIEISIGKLKQNTGFADSRVTN